MGVNPCRTVVSLSPQAKSADVEPALAPLRSERLMNSICRMFVAVLKRQFEQTCGVVSSDTAVNGFSDRFPFRRS